MTSTPTARRFVTACFWLLLAGFVCMTALALGLFGSRVAFLAGAERTTGTVVHLKEDIGSGPDSGGVFLPVVTFRAPDHHKYTFTSDSGTSPPSHHAGDEVPVAFDPANPGDAEIATFVSLWLPAILCGVVALCLLVVVVILDRFRPMGPRRRARLRRKGQHVQLDDWKLVVDYDVTVRGAHPWRAEVEVADPATGEARILRGEPLTTRPDTEAPADVYLDPKRPRRYLVEVPRAAPEPATATAAAPG